MPCIKYNQLTKEIEVMGSESFLELNFSKIQDLLAESFGVKNVISAREAKVNREPITYVEMTESQTGVAIKGHELSEATPTSMATRSSIHELSHESKVKRPPLRKYIRREGGPGQQRVVVEVAEEKPKELTLAALKEKFGLSESKVGGIICDAEKQGKVKRSMNGSYTWTQD